MRDDFFDLIIVPMGGLNYAVFLCVLVTATLAIYAAIKNSQRFWYFLGALVISTLLAVYGYWLRNTLFELKIQDLLIVSGQSRPISGREYFGHLNFILQSMIGVFMMIVTLIIRRFGRERK
ncbi:MAG: hypothetical protein QM496_17060 [Verrucomicrobiota bacterium]